MKVPQEFVSWYRNRHMPNMVEAEKQYKQDREPAGSLTRKELRRYIKLIKNKIPTVNFRQPKILYYDIESTGLAADFGIMLMYAYRWHGEEETHCRTLLDIPKKDWELPPEKRDRTLVIELGKLIDEADIVVAHYGSKFDNRFVQTRLLIHDLPIADIRWAKIFDPCITARKNLKFQSNRMANIAAALGVDQQKTSLPKNIWYRSHTFDGEWFIDAITQMKEYCIQDVRVLYDIAQKIRPICRHLPAFKLMAEVECGNRICRDCGGELTYRGPYYTKANSYDNYQCVSCGAWQRSDIPTSIQKRGTKTSY